MAVFVFAGLTAAARAEDCATASRLTRQAYDMKLDPATFAEQHRLLEEAIRICPQDKEARNQLGSVLEIEGNLPEALAQYQEATRLDPQFATAWFGVGEIYNKTGQFPLALDAYLHACQQDDEARQRIVELLTDNRYQVAPDGVIFEKKSLLLLFERGAAGIAAGKHHCQRAYQHGAVCGRHIGKGKPAAQSGAFRAPRRDGGGGINAARHSIGTP